MPTYGYVCKQCAQKVEAQQSFADPPLETCETCGGALRRVFFPVGVMFKGPGFYSTDARSGGNKKAGSNGQPEKQAETQGGKAAKEKTGSEQRGKKRSESAASGEASRKEKSA